MADADRPGAAEPARPSFRSVRGGGAGRGGWQPRELARRLAMLEQQVEAALSASGVSAPREGRPLVGEALDGALDVYAQVRRWLYEDVVGGLADGGLTGVGLRALYRFWWRVDVRGIERVPGEGRVLLIANRAGSLLPYDALMLPLALALDHPSGRRAYTVLAERVTRLPIVGPLLEQAGVLPGTPSALRRVLARDDAAIAFPAPAMPYGRRYRIGRFAQPGLLRVAIETGAPIVPVAVIGSEETQPVLARIGGIEALGVPPLPITTTFPWLGLPGLVPLPTKWTIHVGEPLIVAGRYGSDTAPDVAAVRALREQVRERLQALVSEGLRRRRGLFTD